MNTPTDILGASRFTAAVAAAASTSAPIGAEISAAAAMPATPAVEAKLSVRDRLKALKAEAGAALTTTLPVSGLSVTYPGFLGHAQVMAATKLAGKDRSKVASIVVAQVCLFEGERLTVDEITGELLHNTDAVHLIDLVLGKAPKAGAEDGEGGSGN